MNLIFALGAHSFVFFTMMAYLLAIVLSNKFSTQFTYSFGLLTLLFFCILMVDIAGLGISRSIMAIGQKLGRLVLCSPY
ncbi:MAG: hypothetical protein R6U96_08380 [Promethearchaeia archaeon]